MTNRLVDLMRIDSKIEFITASKTRQDVEVSIVVPLYNEIENINILYEEMKPVLHSLDKTIEIIFVDDGSTDGTFEQLQKIQKSDSSVVAVIDRWRRRVGHS